MHSIRYRKCVLELHDLLLFANKFLQTKVAQIITIVEVKLKQLSRFSMPKFSSKLVQLLISSLKKSTASKEIVAMSCSFLNMLRPGPEIENQRWQVNFVSVIQLIESHGNDQISISVLSRTFASIILRHTRREFSRRFYSKIHFARSIRE